MPSKIAQWQIASTSTTLVVAVSVCMLSACGGDRQAVPATDESMATAASSADIVQGATNVSTGITTEGTSDFTPVVRAPTDTQIQISDSLDLAGSVRLADSVVGTPTVQWEQLSGPGTAVFSNSQSVISAVRFDRVGAYELKLSATYASFNSSDTMQVIVNSDVINQAPTVNAGSDAIIELDEVLLLNAQVDDDGLPNASLAGQWSKVSGPGTVTIGELSAQNTTATFNSTGDFVLQFTSDDGVLSSSDSIRVSVNSVTPVISNGDNVNASNAWQNVSTSNGSKPQARHEAGAVAFQNRVQRENLYHWFAGLLFPNRVSDSTNSNF